MTEKEDIIAEIEKYQLKILSLLNYDISDSSIKETGMRVAKHLFEYSKNGDNEFQKIVEKLKIFEEKGYDQIVIKKGIQFNSMCEHHLLPFVGEVTIAYLPAENDDGTFRVVGTSKLARIVKYFGMQFTIQERLTADIAYFIKRQLNAKGVWVIVKSKHFCEKIRGIRNSADMITSKLLGEFRTNKLLRRETEFLLSI